MAAAATPVEQVELALLGATGPVPLFQALLPLFRFAPLTRQIIGTTCTESELAAIHGLVVEYIKQQSKSDRPIPAKNSDLGKMLAFLTGVKADNFRLWTVPKGRGQPATPAQQAGEVERGRDAYIDKLINSAPNRRAFKFFTVIPTPTPVASAAPPPPPPLPALAAPVSAASSSPLSVLMGGGGGPANIGAYQSTFVHGSKPPIRKAALSVMSRVAYTDADCLLILKEPNTPVELAYVMQRQMKGYTPVELDQYMPEWATNLAFDRAPLAVRLLSYFDFFVENPELDGKMALDEYHVRLYQLMAERVTIGSGKQIPSMIRATCEAIVNTAARANDPALAAKLQDDKRLYDETLTAPLQAELAKLQAEIVQLASEISTLRGNVAMTTAERDDHLRDLSALQAAFKTKTDELAALTTKHQDTLTTDNLTFLLKYTRTPAIQARVTQFLDTRRAMALAFEQALLEIESNADPSTADGEMVALLDRAEHHMQQMNIELIKPRVGTPLPALRPATPLFVSSSRMVLALMGLVELAVL